MTLDELNLAVETGAIDEMIRVAEARQRKILGQVADAICARTGVRLILLAGASSAGKTTTAKRLCTQLRVNGAEALHLSTDDYFVGDKRNPRDADGNLDYEHVECVDIPRLAADVNALLAGETIAHRKFDFVNHEGFDADDRYSLPENGYVVIEGIHALNPRLTEGVPDTCKFRVFVEPRAQLDVFAMTKLSSRTARFLRRLVRDNQFRKVNPVETFRMWPSVLAGEEKWIDPFRGNADVEFDSALCYELAVLKPYVGGLIQIARKSMGPVLKDSRIPNPDMLFELMQMVHATDPTKVPGDSILRETIGGSQLDY